MREIVNANLPKTNNMVPVGAWQPPVREHSLPALQRSILIAAPSSAARREVREALAGLNFDLYEAAGTADAVASISSNRVDLILVALNFGNLGAIEFCRLLKKAPAMKFLPVFVFSDVDDVESEVGSIEAGADGFFVTPVRARVFQARVQASLRHKAMIDSLDDSESVLFSLAQSMEDRDPGLSQHCERLALMASAMGSSLDLPAEDIVALQRSGYLHDIGKVAVPDEILFKRGPLTPEEWQVMMAHPERGVRICSSMRSLQSVLPIIKHHHERWDGSGYPDKLRGEEIPLLARILQLADIYDALTTVRPYKAAYTAEEAISIIREEAAKGWRDPRLVEQFSEILPMFRASTYGSDLSRFSLQALAASVNRACVPLALISDVHAGI